MLRLEWRRSSFLNYRQHDWQASRNASILISWMLVIHIIFSSTETTFYQIFCWQSLDMGIISYLIRPDLLLNPCHPCSLAQSGSAVTFLSVSLPLITWWCQSHKGTGFGSFSILLQMLKGCQGQQLEAGTVARSKRLSVRLWFEQRQCSSNELQSSLSAVWRMFRLMLALCPFLP